MEMNGRRVSLLRDLALEVRRKCGERWPELVSSIFALVFLGLGAGYRLQATSWGLPYAHSWDDPEITKPSIRVLRDGIYQPTRFAYGPLPAYMHAAWGLLSLMKAIEAGEIVTLWDMKTDWDTGWYWTISSPLFHQRARQLSVLMWVVTAIAAWGCCRAIGSLKGSLAAVGLLAFSIENFGTTSIVSVGAPSLMFTALAFWAALAYMAPSGGRVELTASVLCSAAAFACKLVFMPVLGVPLLGWVAKRLSQRQAIGVWPGVGLVAAVLTVSALLMFPVFLDTPRFVWSILVEQKFYGKETQPMGLGEHLRGAWLMGGAALDFLRLVATKGTLSVSQYRYDYLAYLLICLLGTVLLVKKPWTAWVLLLPALGNLWQVSAFRGEFFARNVLIAQFCGAVVAAVGVEALLSWFSRRRAWMTVVALIFLGMILALPLARVRRLARERATVVDSRVKMEADIRSLVAEGKKVLLASELHWFVPAAADAPPRLPEASLARMLRYPEELRDYDYVVLPRELQLSEARPPYQQAVATWNLVLGRLTPEITYGVDTTYLDRHSVDPRIMLVPVAQLSQPTRRAEPVIFGAEMLSARNFTAGYLTRAGVAVRNYWVGTSRVQLANKARTLVVYGRDLNPFAAESYSSVEVDVRHTTATAQAKSVAKVSLDLSRGTGSLQEYTARVDIDPGDYTDTVRAANPVRRFMTEIGYIEFR